MNQDTLGAMFIGLVLLTGLFLFVKMVRKNNRSSVTLNLDDNGDPIIDGLSIDERREQAKEFAERVQQGEVPAYTGYSNNHP